MDGWLDEGVHVGEVSHGFNELIYQFLVSGIWWTSRQHQSVPRTKFGSHLLTVTTRACGGIRRSLVKATLFNRIRAGNDM